MRIIQSDVIGHFAKKGKRHSVYSVDFQPNGNRVATAGAGKLILVFLYWTIF
jgi:hypothetical protein